MKTISTIVLNRKTDALFDKNQSLFNENFIEDKIHINLENANDKIFVLNVRLLCPLLFIILFLSPSLKAERLFGVNDSTVYAINPNLNYIASRHKFYVQLGNANPQLIKDFTSLCPDTSVWYIADVDFWNAQHGYILLKQKFIGGVAFVYETVDSGITWILRDDWAPQLHYQDVDTAQNPFNHTNYLNGINIDYCNINQLQILDSVLYVFHGYYSSSIYTTTNNGNNWNLWFEVAPSFFFQIKKCNAPISDYYLIGWAGDGFGCRINVIPSDYFSNSYPITAPADTLVYPCSPLNTMHCINGFSQFDSLAVLHPLEEVIENLGLIDSLCLNTPSMVNESLNMQASFQVFPNPFNNKINIETKTLGITIQLKNILGEQVRVMKLLGEKNEIDLSDLTAGIYFIKYELQTVKIIKH